jgi:predicted metal-dependent HD superfamily phosphohydrolase
VLLDEPLRGVVTFLAERVEGAEPEFVDVAVMWLNVIADRRRRDDGALQAIFAKRMLEQLVLPDPGPASC